MLLRNTPGGSVLEMKLEMRQKWPFRPLVSYSHCNWGTSKVAGSSKQDDVFISLTGLEFLLDGSVWRKWKMTLRVCMVCMGLLNGGRAGGHCLRYCCDLCNCSGGKGLLPRRRPGTQFSVIVFVEPVAAFKVQWHSAGVTDAGRTRRRSSAKAPVAVMHFLFPFSNEKIECERIRSNSKPTQAWHEAWIQSVTEVCHSKAQVLNWYGSSAQGEVRKNISIETVKVSIQDSNSILFRIKLKFYFSKIFFSCNSCATLGAGACKARGTCPSTVSWKLRLFAGGLWAVHFLQSWESSSPRSEYKLWEISCCIYMWFFFLGTLTAK